MLTAFSGDRYQDFAVRGDASRAKQEDEHWEPDEAELDEGADGGDGDPELLELVLHETVAKGSRESLDLIFEVARNSQWEDTSHIEAVEEVVAAIVKRRFGPRRFSRRLIGRIARSLVEAPEATVKLERLWQEARFSG